MLKITAAMPVQFGSINTKSLLGSRQIVVSSLVDYEPDQHDVPLVSSTGDKIRIKFSNLYHEWRDRGMVCIIEVSEYDPENLTRSGQPTFKDKFYVARFVKSHDAIIFKLTFLM